MTRSITRLGTILAAVLVVLVVTAAVATAATPSIKLKAASSTVKKGKSVKLTATTAGGTPYEVRIYKKVGTSWNKVATATLVSAGTYVAYVKATTTGSMQLKAAFVNSSGNVQAWSNKVTVKVKS
jgi:hypothetical protein